MYYKLTDNNIFHVFLLDGEFVGVVQEADTDEGYITRYEYIDRDKYDPTTYDPKNNLPLVTFKGRVDYIGDSEKDLPEVLNSRVNKIRGELGLEPHPPIFSVEEWGQ